LDEWTGMVLTLLLAIHFPGGKETVVSQFVEAQNAPNDQIIVNINPQIVSVLDGWSSTEAVSEEYEELDDSGKDIPDDTSKEDPNNRNGYREKEETSLQNMITEQGLVEILERILSFHAFFKCRHPFEWDSLVD
jgi:hypothetical protein